MGSDGKRSARETALDVQLRSVGTFEYDENGNIVVYDYEDDD